MCERGIKVHIIENHNARAGRTYCYVSECMWDKQLKKYKNPRISVGHLEGEPPTFVPNKSFSQLLHSDKENQSLTGARDRLVIDAIILASDGICRRLSILCRQHFADSLH